MVKTRFALTLALLLFGCAPVATIAKPDPAYLAFSELPSRDLEVLAKGPITGGEVQVVGLELVIRSPYCQLEGCAASPDGYIRLTYPEEKNKNYPRRLVIDVLEGVPIKGRALMTLVGEDKTRPALLEVRP